MPKNLVNLNLPVPGVYGLNKQGAGNLLPPQWATEATNAIIDTNGRLAARKGYKHLNITSLAGTVRTMFEYIDASGNTLVIFAANNKIYKDDGDGTYTDISGTMTVPSNDNWKFVNFNGKCIGVQSGEAPIVLSTVGGSFADISVASGTIGTPNECLSAFGRLWTISNSTLKYSALLDETHWTTGAGSFDLSTVWPGGSDVGVALAEFNGNLVVFGTRSIIIYTNPWTPASGSDNVASMELVESIAGMGCISRDTVQHIGTDLLFLSDSGVRGLGRTIQEKSMPDRDFSKNVRDYLTGKVLLENNKQNMKSTFSEKEGFYLLSIPGVSKVFCFDVRGILPDGSVRVTEWDLTLTGLLTIQTLDTYFAELNWYSVYQGYTDAVLQDGTGGSGYTYHYRSPWFDMVEQEVGQFLKIPKSIGATVFGGKGQTFLIEWAFDFDPTYNSIQVVIPSAGTTDQWNIGEWGIMEWAGGENYNKLGAPAHGSGQTVSFGIQGTVNGSFIAVQRLDMLAKIGRLKV